MSDLSTDFLIASGESALVEAGATSLEVTNLLSQVPRARLAQEIWMWQNPNEWAKFALVTHRLHDQVAEPADQQE